MVSTRFNYLSNLITIYNPLFPILETYTQTIIDLRAETTSQNSMLVAWGLSEVDLYNFGTFSVYFGFGKFEFFAGTTKYLFFELEELVSNGNYTIRVELQYPYSALVISSTTHHFLSLSGDTIPITTNAAALGNTDTLSTDQQDTTTEIPTNSEQSSSNTTMYAIISVVVIFVAILLLILIILCVFILCVVKRRSGGKMDSLNKPMHFPQVHANEIYQQVDNINPLNHANKTIICAESVEVSKQTETELDQKVPIPANSDSTVNEYSIDN